MNINTDTSPLQRLGIFFVGLFTFVGFGFLAWITFNLSGGDVDSNYEMKSEARALKINEMVANQDNSYIPTVSDFENYIKINSESEQIISQKPVPGTKTFSEKMAAQMAAQVAAQADASQSTDPKQEVTKKDELIELTINALADPPGTMKFKETELEIKAGAKVSLTFLNPDVLQHNLVLVDKEKKDAVGALADAMLTDPDALKKNYVPESEDIIASTKLVNPGGVDKIEFVAPSEPGDYPYICTFPGHWRLMQGIIKVKASDEKATPEATDSKSSSIAENAKVKDELIELTINALADPPGTMKFKETELEIKAGAKVSLTFLNPDVLQHNLVLVDKEKKDAVGALADAMLTDPDALKKNYVPESEDIIASTKLVNPGGVDKIEFVAPSEPGDYPYICTFPGHWRLMQGIIKVKASDEKATPEATDSKSSSIAENAKVKDELIELTINALADPPGTMKFKETELEIKAGAKVSLTFLNPDVLQHNLVLVDKEKKDAVGALADAMLTDPDALKKNYVPESEDIIASTKLVNPGGVDKIEFVAPSEPGDYPYICTFPGHWRLMQGIIKVKK